MQTKILLGEMKISDVLTSQVNTCGFKLYNPTFAPSEWDEVVVSDGADKLFAGYLQNVTRAQRGLTGLVYQCEASDYSVLLAKKYIKEEYVNCSDAYILNDLFTTYLPEINATTYVETVRTFDRIRFNRISILKALSILSDKSGSDWYLDYDKNLHYFATSTNDAPFSLSSAPNKTTSFPHKDLKTAYDGAKVVNLVEVAGGNFRSPDTYFYFKGTGFDTRIIMPFKMHAPTDETVIKVWRNDAGAGTNLALNPGFEGGTYSPWNFYRAGTSGTAALDDTRYQHGTSSLMMTAGNMVCVMQSSGSIQLDPGETLTVQAQCYASRAAVGATVIYDMTNLVNRMEQYNRKDGEWEWLTCGYYNDIGSTIYVRLELFNNACDGTSIIYFDDAQAEKQTWPSGYIDGSLGGGYAWTGTAYTSTSTRAAYVEQWTPMEVITGYIDELTSKNEVLHYYQEGVIEQENFWPPKENAVKVYGQYEIPLRVRVRNTESYDYYGRWFESLLVDSNILTKYDARVAGQAQLAKYAIAQPAISCTIWEPGIRSGMLLTVVDTLQGINGTYLVQKATMRIVNSTYAETSLELGVYSPSLIDLIIKLARNTETVQDWREDEVLDEIVDSSDYAYLTETTPAIVAALTATVKNWDTLIWNKGKWT